MTKITLAFIFSASLLVGMLVLMEIGRMLGVRRSIQDEEHARAGLGAIEGSIFGLLGLLIAFTFTSAAGRFDHRRDLITQEVNSIGTAWLRLDLVNPRARDALQQQFRNYLDQRLDVYQLVHDRDEALAKLSESQETQRRIWGLAMEAVQVESDKPLAQVLLPALNEMFDTAELRGNAVLMHPPELLFFMLGTVALISSLMAGYGMARGTRSWTHILVFVLVMAGSVYIILDLEYPRLGLIRLDTFDQPLVDLRTSFEQRTSDR